MKYVVVFLLAVVFIGVGCIDSGKRGASLNATQVATPTATPTPVNSFTPTPAATPTATPVANLSFELELRPDFIEATACQDAHVYAVVHGPKGGRSSVQAAFGVGKQANVSGFLNPPEFQLRGDPSVDTSLIVVNAPRCAEGNLSINVSARVCKDDVCGQASKIARVKASVCQAHLSVCPQALDVSDGT